MGFFMGNPIVFLFFLLLRVRVNLTASHNDGVRDDLYRARAGMLAHVYTAKKESLTEHSKNSLNSSLCDLRGVPGSRRPTMIRWRRGRSPSRRQLAFGSTRTCYISSRDEANKNNTMSSSCRDNVPNLMAILKSHFTTKLLPFVIRNSFDAREIKMKEENNCL